jgi:MoaA/NifB/PqqE/SkfB family radical SAM enzyme
MTDATRGEHFRFADAGKVSPNFNKSDVQRRILERVQKHRGWQLGSIDKIIEIQLEPSFPCNLACPGCLQGIHSNPMSTEVGPYVFPYEWFEMMINSIISNNVHLNRMAYVGRGEPTLNRQLSKMISFARQRMPGLQMSMDTNSNQAFLDEYLQLDWINCSIDGCDQDSYSKYRKGGQYSKAIDFMRNGVNKKLLSKSKCVIKWKYILFDTNDTDAQLNKAQSTAESLGVDELNFIITHTGAYDGSVNPSQRFKTVSDLNTYLSANRIFSRTSGSRAT